MSNWKDLYAAAIDAGFFHAVMSAEENASDTIYAEKAAREDEFDALCFCTLAGRLSYGTGEPEQDEAERVFFTAHGVRF
jgi:hypothetical protein